MSDVETILRTDTIKKYIAQADYSVTEFAHKVGIHPRTMLAIVKYEHQGTGGWVNHGRRRADAYWSNMRRKITKAVLDGKA